MPGHWLALATLTPFLVATLLYAFCVASFGTMVGAAIPNQAAAMQAVMFGGFLLVFMLSGLMFPLANVPVGLRWISNFVWARYYIEIVRDVFLQGGGWPAVWWAVLAIGVAVAWNLAPTLLRFVAVPSKLGVSLMGALALTLAHGVTTCAAGAFNCCARGLGGQRAATQCLFGSARPPGPSA